MRPRVALRVALALLACALPSLPRCAGWWCAGHVLIARVAQLRLEAGARAQADALVGMLAPAYDTPAANLSDFVGGACWGDDLGSSYGESLEAGLHFINLPIVEGSTASPIVPPDNSTHGGHNVAWAVGALAATLRSQKAVPLDRARALLLLIHLVGDVHQPLHAATAVSARWPQGDQGGNTFPVSVDFDPTVQSLHQLFDSGCGLWNRQVAQHRPLRGDDAAWLEKWAQNVTAEVPPPEEPFQELPYWWAQESWQLASDIAYAGLARPEEGAEPAVPSPAYVQTAQRALIARAARAGYRLADLLNDALAPTKSGLLGQAAAAAGGSRPRASGAVVVPR